MIQLQSKELLQTIPGSCTPWNTLELWYEAHFWLQNVYQQPFRSSIILKPNFSWAPTQRKSAHIIATQSTISCQELLIHLPFESLSVRVLSFRAMTACKDDNPQTHRVYYHTFTAIKVDVYKQKRRSSLISCLRSYRALIEERKEKWER